MIAEQIAPNTAITGIIGDGYSGKDSVLIVVAVVEDDVVVVPVVVVGVSSHGSSHGRMHFPSSSHH